MFCTPTRFSHFYKSGLRVPLVSVHDTTRYVPELWVVDSENYSKGCCLAEVLWQQTHGDFLWGYAPRIIQCFHATYFNAQCNVSRQAAMDGSQKDGPFNFEGADCYKPSSWKVCLFSSLGKIIKYLLSPAKSIIHRTSDEVNHRST